MNLANGININENLVVLNNDIYINNDSVPGDADVGVFWQDPGALLSTVGSGDITLISGGVSQLGETSSAGGLTLDDSGEGAAEYNAGANSFTVTGTTTIGNGARVEAKTSIWDVGGDWVNDGIFYGPDSIAVFGGAADQSISGINTWGILAVANPGNSVTPSAPQIVSNLLVVSSGEWEPFNGDSYNHVSILEEGFVSPQAGADIYVQGNWTNKGTYDKNGETVIFNYDGATQTIRAGGGHFNNLWHTGLSSVDLVSPELYVDGEFRNTNGTFDATNKDLYLGSVRVDGAKNQEIAMGSGTWTVYGNIDMTGDNLTVYQGASTLKVYGDSNIDVGEGVTFNNLTFGGGNSFNLDSDLSVAGTLDLNDGSVGPSTISGARRISAMGDLRITGTASLEGSEPTIAMNGNAAQLINTNGNLFGQNLLIDKSSGVLTMQGEVHHGGDFTYLRADAVTVQDSTYYAHNNQIYAGGMHFNNFEAFAGDVNLREELEVIGNLGINSGGTLHNNTNYITVHGNWTNNGSFTHNMTGVVEFAGSLPNTIQTGQDESFHDILFRGSGSWTLQDTLNVDSSLTIENGTLDVKEGENNRINISGNWTNNDVFEARGGTVDFNGGALVTQEVRAGNDPFSGVAHSGAGTLQLIDDNINCQTFTSSGGGTLDFNEAQTRWIVATDAMNIQNEFFAENEPNIQAYSFDFSADGHINAWEDPLTLVAGRGPLGNPTEYGSVVCTTEGTAITANGLDLTASVIGTAESPLRTASYDPEGTITPTNPEDDVLAVNLDARTGGIHIDQRGDVVINGFSANGNSSITAHSDVNWNFDAALAGFDLSLSASENVNMNGDLSMTNGSLIFTADNNDNGIGAYVQDILNDKKISTITTGNITLTSGSVATVGDVDCAGNIAFNSSPTQTATYNINSELNIGGSVTIGDGTEVDPNDSEWNIGGSWINNGVVTNELTNDWEIEFVDATQTSNVTGFTTFNDFVCETDGKTLLFQPSAGVNQHAITGVFKVKGSGPGNEVTMNSQGGVGNIWYVNPTGGLDLARVVVSNSTNTNGNYIFSWGSYKGSSEGIAGTTLMWFESEPVIPDTVVPVDPDTSRNTSRLITIIPVVPTSLFDPKDLIGSPPNYGFDVPRIDIDYNGRNPYLRWYIPAIYTSRLYVRQGTSTVVPYDGTTGPSDPGERLYQGDEYIKEHIVTKEREAVIYDEGGVRKEELLGARCRAIIIDVDGEVLVRSSETKRYEAAKKDQELKDGDIVKTKKDSYAIIKIESEGFKSLARLEPNTSIMFMGLVIRSSNLNQAVVMDMPIGEMKLNTEIKDLKKETLEVKTPAFVIKVRESELYIVAQGKDNPYKKIYTAGRYITNVACFEGEVYVRPYDELGVKWDEGEIIKGGEKTSATGEISNT